MPGDTPRSCRPVRLTCRSRNSGKRMAGVNVLASFRLDGDAALVTAGGNGIGRVAALAMAEAGASVAVTDIDDGAAETVAGEIRSNGGEARAWQLDVADAGAIAEVVGKVASAFGRIDVLVNSAGAAKREPTQQLSLDDWHRVIDINLTAAFVASREAGRVMLANSGGRIVNIASVM